MSLATRHGLPLSLTGQLSDASLSLVNEAPRENRFKIFSSTIKHHRIRLASSIGSNNWTYYFRRTRD
jgi:hypothetical protein